MLTERLANWVVAHFTSSPFSEETQLLIRKYAGPPPRDRQLRLQELALVAAYAVALIPFVLLVALAGGLSTALGTPGGDDVIRRVGFAGLAWLCAGLVLHLARYYVVLIAAHRTDASVSSSSDAQRWPLCSADLDFLVQTVGRNLARVPFLPPRL